MDQNQSPPSPTASTIITMANTASKKSIPSGMKTAAMARPVEKLLFS